MYERDKIIVEMPIDLSRLISICLAYGYIGNEDDIPELVDKILDGSKEIVEDGISSGENIEAAERFYNYLYDACIDSVNPRTIDHDKELSRLYGSSVISMFNIIVSEKEITDKMDKEFTVDAVVGENIFVDLGGKREWN